MIENPVVTEDEIADLIVNSFGINRVYDIAPVHGGSSNLYRVETDIGNLLLKQFLAGHLVEGVIIEPVIAGLLRAYGVPTTRFYPTIFGEHAFEFRGHIFHLREYVEGKTYANNTAPDWLLWESAMLLGSIHKALAKHPFLRDGLAAEWFIGQSDGKLYTLMELLDAAEVLPASDIRERIVSDLEYKIAAIPATDGIIIDPGKLTRKNTHGDYSIRQLVCGPRSVRAVIDLSGACVLSVVWEIIRSYSMADPKCADGELDIENLTRYIRIYLANSPELTRYDLSVMPYLYYVHLVRSELGYKQYLMEENEGTKQLLRFGFWRTKVARWLESHTQEVAANISEILPSGIRRAA